MFDRSFTLRLRRVPAADVKRFAILSAIESMVRGMLLTVMPLSVYRVFPDTGTVSLIYFAVGLMSLFVFAGSAQFIGVGLVAEGLDLGFIVLTTFVVIRRHAF